MKNNYFEFHAPTKILAGFDSLDNLPFEIEILNCKNPLIITDYGVKQAGLLRFVEKILSEQNINYHFFDNVPPDSSLETVKEVANVYKIHQCDCIIAVGGGSVIDTAKGVNIAITYNEMDLIKLAGADRLDKKTKPLIVIPTTSGTGSEVTLVAVIYDKKRGIKLPFASNFLLPDVAILDVRMTETLPPQLTAATAMDALTHAIEAYLCLQKNPVSDSFAITAIKLISQNLLKVIEKPKDKYSRLNLAIASTCAGIAFSNSMVGIIHAIGHSIGAISKIPHGTAMSILLPYGIKFYLQNKKDDIGKLLLFLSDEETFINSQNKSEDTVIIIQRLLKILNEKTGLPVTLQEAGVKKNDFNNIAELSLNDGAITFSPVYVSKNDILKILNEAYE
ncbi:iron-containing alcohol dehydrogenase [Deferribacter abyssi]|uniref:iron-containing alcohol dehydrogenase n=1 Tax=Deferribacter abyssi TaxID=213806 RepID=UPI003C1FE90D